MMPQVANGVVSGSTSDSTWGVVLHVDLPDGTTVDARAAFVGARGASGSFDPVPDGASVLVLLPYGDPNGAVALVAGSSVQGAEVPSDFDNAKTVSYGLEERRGGAGDTAEGVLLRPLLDDLSRLIGAMSAVLATLTNPLTPPGTAGQNAAILAALRLLASTPVTGTIAVVDAVKAQVDASKAGQGVGPHCSTVLRASTGA